MTKTKNYFLNQWDAHDPIRRGDFNADNAAIDAALKAVSDRAETDCAAAQSAGDRGLAALRGALSDLCRLAYQADGQGAFTGWRRGFDFDTLDSADRLEAVTGAAVAEPEKGHVRLAVDGWSEGTATLATGSFALPANTTKTVETGDWSPDGVGQLTTAAVTGKISAGVTHSIYLTAEVLQGDTVLATSGEGQITRNGGTANTATLTFASPAALYPGETYRLRLTCRNTSTNTDQTVTLTKAIPLTATPVRCTEGGFAAVPRALTGSEVYAWAQYSAAGTVTAQVEATGVWTDMEPEGEEDSVTPEGEVCTEGRFRLTLPAGARAERLRFAIQSEEECFLYGWGITAV